MSDNHWRALIYYSLVFLNVNCAHWSRVALHPPGVKNMLVIFYASFIQDWITCYGNSIIYSAFYSTWRFGPYLTNQFVYVLTWFLRNEPLAARAKTIQVLFLNLFLNFQVPAKMNDLLTQIHIHVFFTTSRCSYKKNRCRQVQISLSLALCMQYGIILIS